MKKLIVANWKLNPKSLSQAQKLLAATQVLAAKANKTTIVVCPPFQYLFLLLPQFIFQTEPPFKRVIQKVRYFVQFGAQDCFWENNGSYTGEISPKALKYVGVRYVILGHSERRQHLNETDKMIAKKVKAALEAGLKVVFCLGEDLSTYKKGRRAVENFIRYQLFAVLNNISTQRLSNLIVAYEPVWAISTNNQDRYVDFQHLSQIASYLKKLLTSNYRVLYGGSVNRESIPQLVRLGNFDGFLIGAASLNTKSLSSIIKTVEISR